jgi:hypothetical protein
MIPLSQKAIHLRITWAAREGESRKDPYMVERPHGLQGFPHSASLVTDVLSRPEWGLDLLSLPVLIKSKGALEFHLNFKMC